MRIISGKNKGRRITAPGHIPVRPTTDAAKESLFNILIHRFSLEDIRILDLFCGTGNISYEFASRGCGDITSVDLNPDCVRFVRKTSEMLNYDFIRVIQADGLSFVRNSKEQWDIIFADPPYRLENMQTIPETILARGLLSETGWLVVEHDKNLDFSGTPGYFDGRRYGKVHFSFFERI
jgi:16S rRNA (guanine(966)-N(2))-methyltransferase RsmD